MNNTRFSTALHILTLLGRENGTLLSSEYIAGSINVNPAVVRKEISNLRQFGLVESREGKNGGTQLAKPAKDIKLSDVYDAVRVSSLLGRSNQPNPLCAVGKHINKHIDTLYNDAENTMIKQLEKQTLLQFIKQFK